MHRIGSARQALLADASTDAEPDDILDRSLCGSIFLRRLRNSLMGCNILLLHRSILATRLLAAIDLYWAVVKPHAWRVLWRLSSPPALHESHLKLQFSGRNNKSLMLLEIKSVRPRAGVEGMRTTSYWNPRWCYQLYPKPTSYAGGGWRHHARHL